MTAAFFLRYIAPVLAVLTVVGIIYGKGRLDANHANEVKDLRDNLAVVQKNLALEKQARAKDTIAAKEAAKVLGTLNKKIEGLNTYVDKLEDANRVCLTSPDTDQLRQLWKD